MNYEEDFSLRYRLPVIVITISQRFAIYWFGSAVFLIMMSLGDLGRVVRKIEFYYPGQPNSGGESNARYETLYAVYQRRQHV
jgi:hypothetical protein